MDEARENEFHAARMYAEQARERLYMEQLEMLRSGKPDSSPLWERIKELEAKLIATETARDDHAKRADIAESAFITEVSELQSSVLCKIVRIDNMKKRAKEIVEDFIPGNERESMLALEEMRSAVKALAEEQ